MKAPLSWLNEFVEIALPARELARRLTMAGLEVEHIDRADASWDGLVVGRILTVSPHPNAERLQVATVDVAGEQPANIVCGATNIAPGQLVPVALPGQFVGDMKIERRKLRGVLSEGMLCSPKELGISEDHSGILILPEGPNPGSPLVDALGGPVFDIEVTPNRPDCLSIRGIAREVSALLESPLRLPTAAPVESNEPTERLVRVTILDIDLCPRYAARVVRGVTVGPSPAWLRDRLEAAGIRSISNVVDISNYVMLEFGQPLHFFDFAKVRDHAIVVRRARHGEVLTTIDGSERPLDPSMLAICDAEGPVAVAGVMGGQQSEVGPDTRDVLMEAASFAPNSVRRTSKSLNLRSEASMRFERGIDPAYVEPAINRAAELLATIAGGVVTHGIVDVHPSPEPVKTVRLTLDHVEHTLGKTYPTEAIERILTNLGYQLTRDGDGAWNIVIPSFRRDASLVPDVVEDLARIEGYDAIPMTLPSTPPPATVTNAWLGFEGRLRTTALRCGLDEVMAYPLTSAESLQRLTTSDDKTTDGDPRATLPSLRPAGLPAAIEHSIRLRNPLSADWSVLRPTLMDSALKTLSLNARSDDEGVQIFEIGRVYLPSSAQAHELPVERRVLSLAMHGSAFPPTWQERTRDLDFWDLKGAVTAVLDSLSSEPVTWTVGAHPVFHPGRCAWLHCAGKVVGVAGEVHPLCSQAYELPGRALLAEIDLEALAPRTSVDTTAAPSRYPAVRLDMAVVAPKSLTAATVQQAIRRHAGPLCIGIRLFDVYEGTPIAEGQHSLGFTLTFQAPDRTLTIDEVAGVRAAIAAALTQSLSVTVRDG